MSLISSIQRPKALQKVFETLQHKHVRHILFWLAVFVFLNYLNISTEHSLFFTLTNSVLFLFFYMVLVYFNIYYLIPNYLEEKKVLLYFCLLLLGAIILTPIRIMVLYLKFSGKEDFQQELIDETASSFLLFVLIGGASTIVKISSDWVRHQREKKELQTQNMQSELMFLKSQVNPHFLFNTLNSLYALTLKKSDKAPEIVIKLSEMMRYMLYECNEKYVPLYKEINYLRNYLELEKLRQGESIDILFEVSGEVSDQRIAPMMFIHFVENSFKHGINKLLVEGYVHIFLNVESKSILLEIINSKPDTIPMQEHKRSGGIGLKNVKRRLNLIYPGKYKLKLEDSPDKYRVILSLELN